MIKGGIHLEEAGTLKVIAFDKTGTLTRGIPAVTDIVTFGGDENELLMITAALEKGSQHPLASAIMKKAEANGLNYNGLSVEDFQSITGKGIKATIKNERYYVGSPNHVRRNSSQSHGSNMTETNYESSNTRENGHDSWNSQ